MAVQGSPRISLEAFKVRRIARDQQLGRAPRVHVQLSKHDYPKEGIEPLSPQRLPERVQVLLRDIDSSLIEHASVDMELRLVPGTHRFPIASQHHFVVEVSKDTIARAEIQIGPAERDSESTPLLMQVLGNEVKDITSLENRCVVQKLEMNFEPALLLPNLVPTMLEIQELFDDRGLSAFLKRSLARRASKFPAPSGTRQLLESLANVAQTTNRLGHVLLHQIHAKPVFRARTGQWELRLGFSGVVHIQGGPAIPFNDVVLPSVLLPIAYASIDDWITDQPLISADVRKDRVRIDDTLDSLFHIVSSFRGNVQVRGQTPQWLVQTERVDRTEVGVQVSLPQQLVVQGSFEATRNANTLVVGSDDLAIGFPDPSTKLSVRATIEDRGAQHGRWPFRLRYNLENTVVAGSTVPRVEVQVDTKHPYATGTSSLGLTIQDIHLDGGAGGLSICGPNIDLWPMSQSIEISGDFSTRHDFVISEAGLRRKLRVPSGRGAMKLHLGTDRLWHVTLQGEAGFAAEAVKQVRGVPELSIDAGELSFETSGAVRVDVQARVDVATTNAFDAQLEHGIITATLDHAQAAIEDRSIALGPRTDLRIECEQASFSTSGPGPLSFDVAWDMHEHGCWLRAGHQSVSLIAPDLRKNEVTVHLSSEGRLWFSGQRDGLYGFRYFNTLLNPISDPEHLSELMRSEQALGQLMSALELLSPQLADKMSLVRDVFLGVRNIAQRAGIRKLRHFIPRQSMARFFSLVLAGDDSLAARLETQIQNASEARGIDVIEVKNILRVHLDEFDLDYEIAGIVRWLAEILRPMNRVISEAPKHLEPLCTLPEYQAVLSKVPTAGYIYDRLERDEIDDAFVAMLCRYAPRLTQAQLGYVLEHVKPSWSYNAVRWLRYVHSVKARIARIADAYGGVEYVLQDVVIASFLGEAVADGSDAEQVADDAWDDRAKWPPACALGPTEVSVLLSAGLAFDRQSRQTQINNRMLIDLMRARPVRFTQDVLTEIGQHNQRALAGVLFAFLEQQQDHIAEPMDLARLLEEKLHMQVPRCRDYLAGGKRARESYWGALSQLATQIIENSGESCAIRCHLQQQRHAVPTSYQPQSSDCELIERAQRAIELADQTAKLCSFDCHGVTGPVLEAKQRYREAFEASAAVLASDRMAFQASWLKRFWSRNEQALRVLSVVRNYQQDVDKVRPWLHRVCGMHAWKHEQHLLETVIDTLIYYPTDREQLKQDPLVRMMMDEEPGMLDFTVVSAMGVITEGEDGEELKNSFARLALQRGVKLVRASTRTVRSLEENARGILKSLQQVSGPFGWLGYSQGCANLMAAESALRSGTPEQQRILDRLVCRLFLFSALNGSAHGEYSLEKVQQAMIEGERFLKHYQVMVSSEVAAYFLRLVRAVVDSPVFVRVLGGMHSLTLQRAADLHRELQIVQHAPTSYLQAVIEREWLPETLELTYYMLDRMSGGALQDSQVVSSDQVGHSTRVINDSTRLLERCEIVSMPERAHHWSMLTKETEFVTTRKDLERRVYDSPKDRFVFPWIDVNARFGLIKRA